jgi:imidazolonepropionase-like amidohydrolase
MPVELRSDSSPEMQAEAIKRMEKILKPWKRDPPPSYLFTNANVINPTDGSILRDVSVYLENGVVEAIGEDADKMKAAATLKIDMESKYLCPGLIDCHVHLVSVPGESDLKAMKALSAVQSALRQPYVCKQMLRKGFTTVRDCGGAGPALKMALADGVFPGPRLFFAGHALSQSGGHGDQRPMTDQTQCCGGHTFAVGRLCDGVPECLKFAREELRTGADFIKIMAGGGVATPTDKIDHVQFTAEEIRAITTVAQNHGTYVTAHAYTPQAIQQAVRNGVKGIEHGNLLDAQTAALMKQEGVYLTPTLVTYTTMGSPEFSHFLPPSSAGKNRQVLEAGLRSLKIAKEAGVTMCFGTDLLGPLVYAQTKEFAIRNKVLDSLDILQSATINAARMLRQDNSLGQISPGYIADILILASNPLDNIAILDDPESNLLGVLQDGHVVCSRWSMLEAAEE